MLRMEPRAFCMLSKYSATEPYLSLWLWFHPHWHGQALHLEVVSSVRRNFRCRVESGFVCLLSFLCGTSWHLRTDTLFLSMAGKKLYQPQQNQKMKF